MRPLPVVNIRAFTGFLLTGVIMMTAATVSVAATATPPAKSTSQNNVSQAAANDQMSAQIQSAYAAAQADAYKQALGIVSKKTDEESKKAAGAAAGTPAQPAMTQAQLNEQLKDPDSPQYKANALADRAKDNLDLFGKPENKDRIENVSSDPVTPVTMESLQRVHETNGTSFGISDELISKELSLDMRRDSQREAALSYGARGGLAKKSYELMESVQDYEGVLDKVFDFRQLLVKAPSGLLIEPPIVKESLDSLVIEQNGNEAAVADQILKINKQAKIVSAPRDWRQYLVFADFASEIAPPPRVLWPKDAKEQLDWNTWVKQGWEAGFSQGEEIFESNLNKLVADYNGMVRYRMLLAQGKISQPFAMQEDRGVTGGKNEMRVGDRALRITGPSQFLTGAELWKPADR